MTGPVKVYTPEEIAAWTEQNTLPPPKLQPRIAAYWQSQREQVAWAEKAKATRTASREKRA